jgi:hypothetical protein
MITVGRRKSGSIVCVEHLQPGSCFVVLILWLCACVTSQADEKSAADQSPLWLDVSGGRIFILEGHDTTYPAVQGAAFIRLDNQIWNEQSPVSPFPETPIELHLSDSIVFGRSALFTYPDLDIRTAQVKWNDELITPITMHRENQPPRLLAVSIQSQPSGEVPRHTLIILEDQNLKDGRVFVRRSDVLERAYAFLLRQASAQQFELVWGVDAVPEKKLTQAEALKRIAVAREVEANRHPDILLRPWRIVSLSALEKDSRAGENLVSVVALQGNSPAADIMVTFSRKPHMECRARTNERGIASCELYDTHGDSHEDHHDVAGETIATFSGSVKRDFIVLPTTLVD